VRPGGIWYRCVISSESKYHERCRKTGPENDG
jgi:hypothetical protein